MTKISVIDSGYIYDNPLPQLRSRHGYFPSIVMTEDRDLIASYACGEAFESVDLTTVTAVSRDEGKSWKVMGPVLSKEDSGIPVSDFLKLSYLGSGKIIAAGYCFERPDPELPLGNPETGGLLEDYFAFSMSEDFGETWTKPEKVSTSFKGPIEASGPVVLLDNGWLATPITCFLDWDGKLRDELCGRLLVSKDGGKSWSDDSITMKFPEGNVAVFEQRLCSLGNGRLLVTAWNEDIVTGKRYANHYAISEDNGKTFSEPASTGIMGQTMSALQLGGDRILAMHCLRRDTDKPGIYGYIVELSSGRWNIISETPIWQPKAVKGALGNMAGIFSFLRFGQPSAIALGGGEYMITNWIIEEGQGKIAWHRIRIEE